MQETNVFSCILDPEHQEALKQQLEQEGFDFSSAEYTQWRASNGKLTITCYTTGKVLVQGRGILEFVQKYLPMSRSLVEIPGLPPSSPVNSWIGTDEAGKGDYFGPLVIGGVHVDNDSVKKLWLWGVQDSKSMSDKKIAAVAEQIRNEFLYSIVVIEPEEYNECYGPGKNLNRLLAEGHLRVIEHILERVDCEYVLTDQFGDKQYIAESLLKQGRRVNFFQQPKAESNLAVAAASVLARDEFLKGLDKLSRQYGVQLPKGASEQVVKQAKEFVKHHGEELLTRVAKLHFKTTRKVLEK